MQTLTIVEGDELMTPGSAIVPSVMGVMSKKDVDATKHFDASLTDDMGKSNGRPTAPAAASKVSKNNSGNDPEWEGLLKAALNAKGMSLGYVPPMVKDVTTPTPVNAQVSSDDGGAYRVISWKFRVVGKNPIPTITRNNSYLALISEDDETDTGKASEVVMNREPWNGTKPLRDSWLPWICIGDFNAVLSKDDRVNARDVTDGEVVDFKERLIKHQLIIVRRWGRYYSWSHKSMGQDKIASRIDWVVVNEIFLDLFPNVEAIYLSPLLSNHCPIILECFQSREDKGKSFRFLNVLTSCTDFLHVVAKAWTQQTCGSVMYLVWEKLKAIKGALKTLNTQQFSDIQDRIENPQEEFQAIHKYPQQKARVDWVRLGDGNSKYFYSIMKPRECMNMINSMLLEDGCLVRNPYMIKDEIL
ncbi:GTPase-activating protein BEM2/IPL2, partial [Bienertia sinuspersici]